MHASRQKTSFNMYEVHKLFFLSKFVGVVVLYWFCSSKTRIFSSLVELIYCSISLNRWLPSLTFEYMKFLLAELSQSQRFYCIQYDQTWLIPTSSNCQPFQHYLGAAIAPEGTSPEILLLVDGKGNGSTMAEFSSWSSLIIVRIGSLVQ